MQLKVADIAAIASTIVAVATYLRWKKRLVTKILAVIALIAVVIAFSSHSGDQKAIDSHNTVSTTGSNSPVVQFNAVSTGGNSPIYQSSTNVLVASGAVVNNGLTEAMLTEIREGMLAVQKQKDAELRAKFNVGYVLFRASERDEVVPLHSPWDSMIKIDWKSQFNVNFSADFVTLQLPDIIFQPTNAAAVRFGGQTIQVGRRYEPFARPGIVIGNYRLAFKVVSTNADSITIAMGIQSPPEPRPPLSELVK